MSRGRRIGRVVAGSTAPIGLCAAVLLWSGWFGTVAAQSPPRDKAAQRQSASFIGKPSAPIGVDYDIAGVARLGQTTVLTLTIEVPAAFSDVSLTLHGGEGLIVTGVDGGYVSSPMPLPDIAAAGTDVTTFAVTPLTSEVLYLNVIVAGEMDGIRQARSLSIPFRLAESRRLPDAAILREAGTGEVLRSMPAR